ncbi:MAG: hypothetical protein E5X07_18670 [Mesorhizobium sp.]|uniref:hypothetical protein n=1 Tax=Mesorhizobium sp. TaxID=1871066 RepID=UPI0011F4740C|nr:hypothetical protein [Mesorhizobium sp.]TIM58814.1 MAG: hypothetical protein E5Y46_00005 [Mesorhizobium sp.]TIQ68529.1 MAG: hypothetical protein E5X41_00180 [Mesorhizobium sp.]TIR29824.1 MAG: hypothetical protein E5X35_25205 [Mesorhizobium sp.]TIS22688.1 MAG: hypothetical protein E5X07_18670 [Mesorhizobium sp.]
MFLFPPTSQRPDRSRPHLAISEIECRRGGLDYPSWLILDEYNRVQVDEAYDLVTTTTLGAFSSAFVRKIAGVSKETAARRRLRGIICK